MNPSRIFIVRPVATTMLMIGVVLVGIAGYRLLPISALPEVDYPTIQVTTFYPGASPDVMASSVTAPLERQFGQVPGLQQMTSTSSSGSSVITLQFSLTLSIDIAEQEVQQSINASGTYLPADLPGPPTYTKTNPADAPILTLALTSKDLPLSKVEDLADTRLAPKISQLSGVGLVSMSGGQKPAVRIQVNPTAMASYGLNLEDLRTAIVAANVNQAKGNFAGPRQSYQIEANDQLLSSEDYAALIIAYKNGAPIALTSVANVVDDIEDVRQAAWMDQTPAVIMNIQRQPGANIISVVDRIKKLLPQLTNSLPESIKVRVLTDRTTTIRASVSDVQFELILTIVLVVFVMFVFLRSIAATIIPSVSVPISLIATFGVMYLLGYSLNNLTLMALTISTGFVVDDAIVMTENITRFIEAGDAPLEAALKGSEQIGFTIVSLTVSLIAVLIPLLFMGDIVGRLFREFAVTLSITILASAAVSLTLTPMMSARLVKAKAEGQRGRLYRASEHAFEAVIAFYGRTLRWVLARQLATLVVATATLCVTVLLYIFIPKGFFPIQDTGVIQGVSEAAQSVSFSEMAREQQQLAQIILADPAVDSLSSFIGIDGTNTTLNSGRILINLKPLGERHINASDLVRRLQPALAKVPGMTLYMQPIQDLSVEDRVSRTQFQYTLEDPNVDELNTFAPRLLDRLRQLPELSDVASDQQVEGLRAEITFDRNTAARFGITAAAVDQALYDAYGQRQVSTMFTQLNQYHVVLEVQPGFAQNPSDLNHLFVRTAAATPTSGGSATGSSATSSPIQSSSVFAHAGQVPLDSFSTVKTDAGPITVNHQGQFPVVTLSFNLAPGVSLGAAVKAVNSAQQAIAMPASIQAAFQGTAEAFQASLANEPILIAAALITVYLVLGVLYESYIHPLTILSALPSAGVGALLALIICGEEFSVIALIGIVLLIGIVKKNAIMMIDFALVAERKDHVVPEEAIYQAALLRFRPIMMTTMAALLGAVPLALGTGSGSELRRPLGIAIIGGLLISQLLTLYTTPVIYVWFDRLAARVSERRAGAPSA